MDLLAMMKKRRSIRKYTDEPVSKKDLEKVLEAGLYAPNAGGGQRTFLLTLYGKAVSDKVGRINAACMRKYKLAGAAHVSDEQPSLIDDPNMPSGFYGAPCVVAIFGQKNFLYGTADTFCCAENMILEATNLGLASCIVARGEDTFATPEGQALLQKWQVPEDMECHAFVLLGHIDGAFPHGKPRRAGRNMIVTA